MTNFMRMKSRAMLRSQLSTVSSSQTTCQNCLAGSLRKRPGEVFLRQVPFFLATGRRARKQDKYLSVLSGGLLRLHCVEIAGLVSDDLVPCGPQHMGEVL